MSRYDKNEDTNVGPYDKDLPDVSAFPAALFSKLPGDTVYDIMMDRFNIEYDDVLREGVERMSSLREDTYNRGFNDGQVDGIERGREEGIDLGMINSLSDTVVALVKEEKWSLEKAISLSSIPDGLKESVRKEAVRKLES